jgi:hypothetical protein
LLRQERIEPFSLIKVAAVFTEKPSLPMLKDTPIRQKLIVIILLTSGTVLLLTCASFFTYELLTFRKNMVRQTSTLGQIVADNSTAALAFQNGDDAREILNALKAEPHIVAAGLYTKE